MTDFTEGDRVRVKEDEAPYFTQPFKRLIEARRVATIQGILGTELAYGYQEARIVFDVKKAGAVAQSAFVLLTDLEHARDDAA